MATPRIVHERLSDEYIDRWGRVFVQHRLNMTLGINFEQFLRVPGHYMNQYHEMMNSDEHKDAVAVRLSDGEFAPLLARQAAVRERVYRQSIKDAIFRASNGIATIDDADLLERAIRAARGIRDVPRQNNGQAIEKMVHHRHPKSRSMFPEGGKS